MDSLKNIHNDVQSDSGMNDFCANGPKTLPLLPSGMLSFYNQVTSACNVALVVWSQATWFGWHTGSGKGTERRTSWMTPSINCSARW
jgi:hypothetical protein